MASSRETIHHDIEKAKEEETARVTITLKNQYEGEMSWLEGLLRDNWAQSEKITLLEAQLVKERSAVEVRLHISNEYKY